jgi:phosphopantetheinyl transferase
MPNSAASTPDWSSVRLDAENDVHIWLIDTDKFTPQALSSEIEALLSDAERVRYTGYRFARDRDRFLLSRWLRHVVLSHYLEHHCLDDCAAFTTLTDASLRLSTRGKPQFAGAGELPFGFSMSHSHPYVALAVSLQPATGVDLELLPDQEVPRETWSGAAEAFFAADEIAWLNQHAARDQYRCFLELWTLKESVIKACDTTLHYALPEVVCYLAGGQPLVTMPSPRGEITYTHLQAVQCRVAQKCLLSVAIASSQPVSSPSLKVFELSGRQQFKRRSHQYVRFASQW